MWAHGEKREGGYVYPPAEGSTLVGNEQWAVGSAARVLCWASWTSSAKSQGIWVDYIPTGSCPPANTVMDLTEVSLSHLLAEDGVLAWDRTEAGDQPGSASRSTGAL